MLNPPLSTTQAWMVLNALPHIGPIGTRRLLEAFDGEVHAILSASPDSLRQVKGIGEKAAATLSEWQKHFSPEKEKAEITQRGLRFIDWTQPQYPSRLNTLPDAPIALYSLGPYRFKARQPAIAIVGCRNASLYGLKVARQLAQRLGSMGFCIVSGMARGIDTAAHEGALEVGADTIAVLGTGIDLIYPAENLELYRKLAEKGLILSEFCLGRRADRQTFPMRNRIVSGLSDAVVVVESDNSGGSMITARFAGEQGRQVYAVPGRIDQATSKGCHQLIRDGAILITGVEDILEDLRYRIEDLSESNSLPLNRSDPPPVAHPNTGITAPAPNDEREKTLIDLLRKEGELSTDELVSLSELPIAPLNACLMGLELRRLIIRQNNGNYSLR
jgi:DNA processing protein